MIYRQIDMAYPVGIIPAGISTALIRALLDTQVQQIVIYENTVDYQRQMDRIIPDGTSNALSRALLDTQVQQIVIYDNTVD